MKIYWLAPILIMFSCNKGKNNETACNGDTRREVKILIDTESSKLNETPIFTTIDSLQNIIVDEPKSDTPRMSVEYQVYKITATVEKVKKERDGDFHLRMTDGENYLIAEAANPNCEYLENSVRKSTYQTVVNFINNNDLEGKTITITGVCFIDIDHHYKRKQAKNNLEFHPILSISF
jgi:hypothetical protein